MFSTCWRFVGDQNNISLRVRVTGNQGLHTKGFSSAHHPDTVYCSTVPLPRPWALLCSSCAGQTLTPHPRKLIMSNHGKTTTTWLT